MGDKNLSLIIIMKKQTYKYEANINTVEKKLNGIVGLRGDKRKTALSAASTNLYNYLKTLNYDNVTRGFLKREIKRFIERGIIMVTGILIGLIVGFCVGVRAHWCKINDEVKVGYMQHGKRIYKVGLHV